MTASSYPASWYAATANRHDAYPVLDGERRTDVCVIGAGYTGLSAALELAERGYDVTVLEGARVGWGASGRNGGQLIGGLSGEERLARKLGRQGARLLRELRWAGHDIVRGRIRRFDIRCSLKYGYVDVASNARQLRAHAARLRSLESEGVDAAVRLLSAPDIRDMLGTSAYVGGLLNMANGHLHPLNLCLGEAAAAAGRGVAIFENSRAIAIEAGRRPVVVTAGGRVSADVVVLAGNAYHALAGSLADRMLPFNSYIIATQPLSDGQARLLNPRDVAVCNSDHIIEYFRLSDDQRLLFGGRCDYAGEDPRRIEQELRPRMLRIYPQLESVPIDYAWGGRIGIPFNRVPLLGRLGDNLYYAQGYSGHGVNVSHLAGAILAEAIHGRSERFDLFAGLGSRRLPGARYLAGGIVALAIAWYRLRDAVERKFGGRP